MTFKKRNFNGTSIFCYLALDVNNVPLLLLLLLFIVCSNYLGNDTNISTNTFRFVAIVNVFESCGGWLGCCFVFLVLFLLADFYRISDAAYS